MPEGTEPGAGHRAYPRAAPAPLELTASRLFYPAAALYAAIVLPLSVFWMPQWHPREMLFGFALAVVAGNQLGVVRGARLLAVFALWVFARIAAFLWPGDEVFVIGNAAFAVALAASIAPRLLGAAKKWRNRALPVVLVALCIAAALLEVRAAVLLFATLMLFMGGRIIAPAVAGQLERQGIRLAARVQPRLEGGLLVAMGVSFLFSPFCMVAGILAAIRLARWRLWRLRGRPDLLCLASGYAWLAAGLAAFGIRPEAATTHLITVGALGTLTFNVMATSWLLKARRDPAGSPLIIGGTVLIGAAALLRLGEAFAAASLCWSAAYVLLLVLFVSTRAPAASRT